MEQGKANGAAMIALPGAGAAAFAVRGPCPIHLRALKKTPGDLIPQAIGRTAAWATTEHNHNDR
ncbi:hypothetical protein NCPPB940_18350 [Xanthomonas hortorum pv. taraxaci]|nr:hypothetical protein NCPPB940_18350 [Xanthomonas hortorum pv. taraxaci]CAD0324744.1 hypothetical protein NCPPB940_18350 [Xanthomonas hortorum pv. taraxaci]